MSDAEAIAAQLVDEMSRAVGGPPLARSSDGLVVFDPTTHTYRHVPTDSELPSVTRLLESTGIREPYRGDPIYGQRGTWVHDCAELVNQGDMDWERGESEHPDWIGYVRAYALFLQQNTVEVLGTEEVIWSEPWWYAGKRDYRVVFNGTPTLLDLKTGQPSRSDVVQLALYDVEGGHDLRPVYLRADGNYRAPPVEAEIQDRARRVALCALGIMQWKGRK